MSTDEWPHEYHLATGYCVHCGLSITHIDNPPYQCHRENNVISITHKVRPNVLQPTTTDNDSNT
jgi:hypothetical protein